MSDRRTADERFGRRLAARRDGLPLRDKTVDAVVSIRVLQLTRDPVAALGEMTRVLRPGGRLAIMVPTTGRVGRGFRMPPGAGVYWFGEDELGHILEDHGFVGIGAKRVSTVQWVRGKHC